MKQLVWFFFLGTWLMQSLSAQPLPVEKRAEKLTKRMQVELKFDQNVYNQVLEINTEYLRTKRTIMQSRIRQDLKQKQLKEAKRVQNEKMKAVLTKKQYEQYLEMDIKRPVGPLQQKRQRRLMH